MKSKTKFRLALVAALGLAAIAQRQSLESAQSPAAVPVASSSEDSAQADGCLCGPGCQCRVDIAEVAEVSEPALITYSLVLVTADFRCPPCETAKEHLVPWLEDYGWEIQVCEGGYGVTSFPTWIVLKEGEQVHRWTGAAWSRSGRANVIQHLRQAKGEAAPVSFTAPSLRDWINSHYQQGQHLSWGVSGSVRSHLQDGSHGTHIWRDDQIDGLTQWEMLCLHDATHRGLINPREW